MLRQSGIGGGSPIIPLYPTYPSHFLNKLYPRPLALTFHLLRKFSLYTENVSMLCSTPYPFPQRSGDSAVSRRLRKYIAGVRGLVGRHCGWDTATLQPAMRQHKRCHHTNGFETFPMRLSNSKHASWGENVIES
jgi:hypothetical protein